MFSSWEQFRDFFTSTELAIPAIQMISYVVIINLLMLFNRYRSCFLISLSFSFYWLFILNKEIFVNTEGELSGGVYYYLGAAAVFLVAIFFSLSSLDSKLR